MSNDPLGSIWRKWDLHLHTPASFDYDDKSVCNQQIADALIENEVALCAITDHHVIDADMISGIREAVAGKVTILPGIELRSELGGRECVHFCGIFPETADIADIWTMLQGTLALTPAAIAQQGDDSVHVDFKDAAKKIHELGGLVSVHAGSKTNGIESISNEHEYKQALKRDLAKEHVDFFEIGKPEDKVSYTRIVFPYIEKTLPVIMGSDSHDIKQYALRGPCWVKADPTFAGLRQILIESEERVYLGDKPPSLVRFDGNPTKYISKVTIKKRDGAEVAGDWFDSEVPLNYEMVAVIGNKGSGKSAFSDSLGLAGNSPQATHFSFLTDKKFRKLPENKAKAFDVSLGWHDGSINTCSMADNPPDDAVELVKYIPQSYLEAICNELASQDGSKFDKELKDVIFSHVSQEGRLEKNSLDELVRFLTEEADDAVKALQTKIHDVNELILDLRKQLAEGHRKNLENQLAQKEKELAAHDEAKPQPVEKPDEDEETKKRIAETAAKIEGKRAELDAARTKVNEAIKQRKILVKQEADIEKLIQRLLNLQKSYEDFSLENTQLLSELGISLDEIVVFECKRDAIDALSKKVTSQKEKLDHTLARDEPDSLVAAAEAIEKELGELQKTLDKPNQEYQAYLTRLKVWEDARVEIVGDGETPETVEYLKATIQSLDGIPKSLDEAIKRRDLLCGQVFEKIAEHVKVLEDLYSPIQDFVQNHELAKTGIKLDFDVHISPIQFSDLFFSHVNQGRAGSFCGSGPGQKMLKTLLDNAAFDTVEGVMAFLGQVEHHLLRDMREGQNQDVDLESQLRKGATPIKLMDWLFSLDYLEPKYELLWDEKPIGQLSPGERGTLLLVFYLLIDKKDIPLIIDQPEENLDNQTVFNVLVPAIKEAKTRRQILVVTHNPNLAVVCDANQVIYAQFERANSRITYEPGAIENPCTNRHILDILEGTRPAFSNRGQKYGVVGEDAE